MKARGSTAARRGSGARRASQTDPLAEFRDGWTLLFNPSREALAAALEKVQRRATRNLERAVEVHALTNLVVAGLGGWTMGGFRACPRHYKYGIPGTGLVAVRLLDDLVGVAIKRYTAQPGEPVLKPMTADIEDDAARWLNEVMAIFWTGLTPDQAAGIRLRAKEALQAQGEQTRQREMATRMQRREASRQWRRRRKMQLQALLRHGEPGYVSELADSLSRIAGEMAAAGEAEVSWRAFQQRWPGLAMRYKRDLVGLQRGGKLHRDTLAGWRDEVCRFPLKFGVWTGMQRLFEVPQLLVYVCSPQLAMLRGNGRRQEEGNLLRAIMRFEVFCPGHPATELTAGWLRVHMDDANRLVFVDEVQSDVYEFLRTAQDEFDGEVTALRRELEDWHVHAFSSLRCWARGIGYRIAIHSRETAATVRGKTRSERKWRTCYESLIRRFDLRREEVAGYPAPIHVEARTDA